MVTIETRAAEALRTLALDEVFKHVRDDKGRFSMGGMASKLSAIKFAVEAGIETHIAHGRHPERLATILDGSGISTKFHASPRKA